jgi:hypothetical protein
MVVTPHSIQLTTTDHSTRQQTKQQAAPQPVKPAAAATALVGKDSIASIHALLQSMQHANGPTLLRGSNHVPIAVDVIKCCNLQRRNVNHLYPG